MNDFKEKCHEYKKCIKRTSSNYLKSLHLNLRTVKSTNPKEFWSLLNLNETGKTKKGSDLCLDTFYEHFKLLCQSTNATPNVLDIRLNNSFTKRRCQ